MAVILFMPRFHGKVESGQKTQTIRRPRKRSVKPGEKVSLRGWKDKPYRSKQRVLAQSKCWAVYPVRIDRDGDGLAVWIGGQRLNREGDNGFLSLDQFARDDGFDDEQDMRRHWEEHNGLPFDGELITWLPPRDYDQTTKGGAN